MVALVAIVALVALAAMVAWVALAAMGIGQPLHHKILVIPVAPSDNSINIKINFNVNRKVDITCLTYAELL